MTNEGRQPAVRHETLEALAAVRAGSLAATLLDWDHVDTLRQEDVTKAHIDLCELGKRVAEAQYQMGRVMAKRTGQSVSGRLQSQIDALTRKLETGDQVPAANYANLAEENGRLRGKLARVKALFVDGTEDVMARDHEYEPGDTTHPMSTDPDCRVCGETRRTCEGQR